MAQRVEDTPASKRGGTRATSQSFLEPCEKRNRPPQNARATRSKSVHLERQDRGGVRRTVPGSKLTRTCDAAFADSPDGFPTVDLTHALCLRKHCSTTELRRPAGKGAQYSNFDFKRQAAFVRPAGLLAEGESAV